jgi:uncharacterized membrane protein YjjP (DUF1212 family)
MGNSHKPPLDHETLRDVIDLALWAGQMLLHYGADSQRVEETVHRLGTGLGCDWMDILVSPNAIIATTSSGIEFRTKVRRVVGMGVNLDVIRAINEISRQVQAGTMDRQKVRQELLWIDRLPHQYNRWSLILMVGLACAAFSQLFGGDMAEFFATLVSASLAMFVRQELMRAWFNHYLVVIATAFVAGFSAALLQRLLVVEDISTTLAASVLLLVPGVPLINAAQDLIKGHSVTGITRALVGGIVALSIALGLSLAMALWGVEGL